MFKDIICPISAERLNKHASRVGASLTAALLVAYFTTRWWPILAVVVLDYVIRVFTSQTAPIAFVANGLLKALAIAPSPMDKAPKIFAWRVGFLMAVVAAAVAPFSLSASAAIALALAAFNVLDGVFNFCVGCVMYTHLILPRFRSGEAV